MRRPISSCTDGTSRSGPTERDRARPSTRNQRRRIHMTRSRIPRLAISCLSLASWLALGACGKGGGKAPEGSDKSAGSSAGAGPATAVTLQLNWTPEPEFGGFYAAVHDRLYEREGLDVSIKAGGAGTQTWKMVATGSVPFAIAEGGEILRARLK